jgi:hypothetical protein
MGWLEHVARMGDRRIACRILVGEPEVKYHLRNLGVEIKMVFTERGWEGLSWFSEWTSVGSVLNTVMELRVL